MFGDRVVVVSSNPTFGLWNRHLLEGGVHIKVGVEEREYDDDWMEQKTPQPINDFFIHECYCQ
jgi:hypothetical protein